MASGKLPSNMEPRYFDHPGRTSTNKNITQDFINSETNKLQNEAGSSAQSAIQVEPPTADESGNKGDSGQSNPPKQGLSLNSNKVIVRKRSDYQTLVSPLENDASNNHNKSSETKIKEPDLSIDDNLPETVTLLRTPEGGKCYLIGTAHFSLESQNDVSKIIQAVQPHIIMVELCLDRIHVLQLDEETILEEAKNLSFSKITSTIKEHGVHRGLFYLLLLNMSAYLTKVLGLAPGGEFRRAFQEAKKVPHCILQMGDRPIGITFARALSSLSWWQTAKLTWHLLTERDNLLSQKDIEKFKSRDALEQMMAELAGEYPAVEEVFVKERDLFLTYSLQMSCKPKMGPDGRPVLPRVVGVVGIGHTLGIIEHWGKVKRSQIPPILHVPPPSLSSKILSLTFKACILGSGIFIGYKVVKVTPSIVSSLKSSVEGLLKLIFRDWNMVSTEAKCCPDEYEHLTSDLMYTVGNIPGPGIDPDDFESEFFVGCSCNHECKDQCSCTRGTQNYINEKLAMDNKNSIIECNTHCQCADSCGNRLVQFGPLDCLVILKAFNQRMGYGLFTKKLIEKGRFICEYAGEVIGIGEACRRLEENRAKGLMNYVLVVSEHIGDKKITTCIDPAKFGNIGRYANHSCEPNAILVPVRVDIAVPKLCLFAIKDIEPMEEITFNYAGDVVDSVHKLSETPCLCGSDVCRGRLPHCPL